ncbi:hypothetical protein Hamer_G017486 [Homarus americanus]|uniref:Uncharacterized protein n=1 Tax=Homarus americanus TaxID=6706 RepID=A0A8J5JS93_HOMAM|nr:hypothetical protein Hamer_G017486 [Homarus americanus]
MRTEQNRTEQNRTEQNRSEQNRKLLFSRGQCQRGTQRQEPATVIMPHVEVIYNQMQSREIDVFKVHEYITNFKAAILEIRNLKYCEKPSKTLMAEGKEDLIKQNKKKGVQLSLEQHFKHPSLDEEAGCPAASSQLRNETWKTDSCILETETLKAVIAERGPRNGMLIASDWRIRHGRLIVVTWQQRCKKQRETFTKNLLGIGLGLSGSAGLLSIASALAMLLSMASGPTSLWGLCSTGIAIRSELELEDHLLSHQEMSHPYH